MPRAVGRYHRLDRGPVADRGMAPYVSAKHGVIGLTIAAAIDYARQGQISVREMGGAGPKTAAAAMRTK